MDGGGYRGTKRRLGLETAFARAEESYFQAQRLPRTRQKQPAAGAAAATAQIRARRQRGSLRRATVSNTSSCRQGGSAFDGGGEVTHGRGETGQSISASDSIDVGRQPLNFLRPNDQQKRTCEGAKRTRQRAREEESKRRSGDGYGDSGTGGHDCVRERATEMRREIEHTRSMIPDESLLNLVHYLAAHYYDARERLYDPSSPRNKRSATGGRECQRQPSTTRRPSMLRVCEGSALVATGVLLEELVKWEAGLGAAPTQWGDQPGNTVADDVDNDNDNEEEDAVDSGAAECDDPSEEACEIDRASTPQLAQEALLASRADEARRARNAARRRRRRRRARSKRAIPSPDCCETGASYSGDPMRFASDVDVDDDDDD